MLKCHLDNINRNKIKLNALYKNGNILYIYWVWFDQHQAIVESSATVLKQVT